MSLRDARGSSVTVLGAGIVGICTALTLLEQGYKVQIIDRLPAGEATSYGNAGVISPWSCVPQCLPGTLFQVPRWLLDPLGPVRVRWQDIAVILPWAVQFIRNTSRSRVERISDAMDTLVRDNVHSYKRFLAGTGSEYLLRDSWYINVLESDSAPDLSALSWALRLKRGAPLEVVAAGELADIEPAISSHYRSAIVLKDQARAVDPGALCKALAQQASKRGATFVRSNVRTLRVNQSSGNLKRYSLLLENGPLHCDQLVLCGGIWSAELLRPLGIKVPLMAERGYHLEFANPGVSLNHSIMDMAGKIVVSSMQGGIRSAGTSEFSRVDAPPDYRRAHNLAPLTQRLLPDLNLDSTTPWMGIRPSFPDNLPAIGAVPGFAGLVTAFGHSHYGLGMAPATGRLVAEAISGQTPNENRDCYSIARFQ